MEQNQKRKTDGLGELLLKEMPRLRSFVRRLGLSKEDAEDIQQDAVYFFLRTVSETFEPIDHVSAWLYRVTHNLIVNHGRKRREEELPVVYDDEGNAMMDYLSEVFLAEDNPEPDTVYLRKIVWRELNKALDLLPSEQKYVFVQTEFEGRSFKAISQQTGIGVNTLLWRKHAAVKFLRLKLGKLYDDIINQ